LKKGKLKTINPATEEVLNEYNIITKDEINEVKRSHEAYKDWKKDIHKRAHFLHSFANELRKNKEKLAKICTTC
jgi:acyl-CoA reductase-like NAD-dependent aldehyde dehydrogenase